MRRVWVAVGTIALAIAARPASAQGFLSAGIGAGTKSSSGLISNTGPSYQGQLGWWSKGWFGLEGDYGYQAKTQGGGVGDNIRTVSFDIMIGPIFSKGAFRAYGIGGVGLIGAVGTLSDIFKVTQSTSEQALGANGGGGVSWAFSKHFGVRGDVRYFRVVQKLKVDDVKPYFLRFGAGLALIF